MPKITQFIDIPLNAAGGAVSLDTLDYVEEYHIISAGAVSLAGSWTIAPTGTPTAGMVFVFKYDAVVTLGAFSVSVFGRSLLKGEALSKCVITALWDDVAAAWIVDVVTSNNNATNSLVLAEATDPAAGMLDAKIEDSIVIDAAAHAIHLDGDDAAPADNTHYGKQGGVKGWFPDVLVPPVLQTAVVQIAHADILTLQSVPVLIVPPPGIGKITQLISASTNTSVGWSTPYLENQKLLIYTDTATQPIYEEDEILTSTNHRNGLAQPQYFLDDSGTQFIANKGIYATVGVGNPTGGLAGQILTIAVSYLIW